MANRLKVFANPTLANFKLAGITALLLFASAELSALGLGTLEVKSNLDEPLRGVIELRTSSGDDIDSVRASIASQADFENLGIDYPSYLADISLSVDRDGGSMILRVDSADVIIKEPFIHFLVRVDWSGGSFLREYTALIDPPVYAAEAPTLLAEPKLVGTDQSYDTGTIDSYDLDAVEAASESEIVQSEISDPEPIYGEEPVAYEEPAAAEPSSSSETTSADSGDYYEPEAVSDAITQDSSSGGSVSSQTTQATDAQYGPVASGESLSVIAADLQRQFPDLSIYQIMQVMFEENQSAFINGNINGLIMGSVLNIGDLNVIRAVDVEQSKIFFRNQVREWDPSLLASSESDAVKVGQDEYSFESDSFSSDSDDDSAFSTADSEVVDNFQVGSSGTTDSFVSDGSGDSSAGEVIALRQQITELQTSLASGSVENQELTERISILEGQLADMNRLMSLSVEDADLANVEATLAAQNNADAALSDDSGDELYDVAEFEDLSNEDAAVDSEFVDNLLEEAGAGGASADLTSDELTDGIDGIQQGSDAASTELAVVETAPVAAKTTPAPVKPEPSFLQGISDFLFGDGMWKIIAGIGALLVGGIVLLVMRRRRADEEFEVSMMSIGTNSQSIDDPSTVSASASMSSSVSQPSNHKDEEGPDKETSFLTVYSDSDAVVQADEVDPIAEADVYIAYGRDEQAEEVLLDGVTGNPERYDIKHKLLGLYHKNKNAEGFERVAEELYSQRQQLPSDVWQDVCKMGKEIATDNPLFDLSSDDFAAASLVGDTVPQNPVEQPQDEAGELETLAQESASEVKDAVEEISVMGDNVEYQVEEIEDHSEAIGNALDGDDDNSIQLINFDDGRSEISELDEVEIDALDLDDEEGNSLQGVDLPDSDDLTQDSLEIDLSDEIDELDIDSVEFDNSPTLVESVDADESEERSLRDVQEVSDMEIDADYDEARTQYELAKVFVDLGDEDGARKILNDIVENSENSVEVLTDANALLASIA
jgi:pilus assembly protein FimV